MRSKFLHREDAEKGLRNLSQSLLNEVKVSTRPGHPDYVDVYQSQSLLNEVKVSTSRNHFQRCCVFSGVAIPFKWGQSFYATRGVVWIRPEAESQSLLNEVKVSTRRVGIKISARTQVAIPFKWGQSFYCTPTFLFIISIWCKRGCTAFLSFE